MGAAEILKRARRELASIHQDAWIPEPQKHENPVVIWIGERPGPRGPKKSAMVSWENDDQTARFTKKCFETLQEANPRWKSTDFYLTNACMWVDRHAETNQTPKAREVKECTKYLKELIVALQPKVVLACGGKALLALKHIYPDNIELREYRLARDIGSGNRKAILIDDGSTQFYVYPILHTSCRTQSIRPRNLQQEDWKEIDVLVTRLRPKAL